VKMSLFIGDAAGRPAKGPKKKKDFNDTDLKFAINLGLRFQTPEMCFLGASEIVPMSFEFDPRDLGKSASGGSSVAPREAQEMVIMVGPPGSGKTTFSRKCFSDYVHVNQDTLKTADKCHRVTAEALKGGKSVVVDNQNKEKRTRKSYIELARKEGVPIRAVFLNYPKQMCFHLNAYRLLNPRVPEHRKEKVPQVTIHSFYKYLEIPRCDEGFDEVIQLTETQFVPGPFNHPEDETLLNMFLE